jgi:hypothetical protein
VAIAAAPHANPTCCSNRVLRRLDPTAFPRLASFTGNIRSRRILFALRHATKRRFGSTSQRDGSLSRAQCSLSVAVLPHAADRPWPQPRTVPHPPEGASLGYPLDIKAAASFACPAQDANPAWDKPYPPLRADRTLAVSLYLALAHKDPCRVVLGLYGWSVPVACDRVAPIAAPKRREPVAVLPLGRLPGLP